MAEKVTSKVMTMTITTVMTMITITAMTMVMTAKMNKIVRDIDMVTNAQNTVARLGRRLVRSSGVQMKCGPTMSLLGPA